MKNQKKETWRIIVGIISIVFIIFMWVKNDIVALYTTMPKEQVIPLIITTIMVSLLKISVIAGIVLIIKWIIKKSEIKAVTNNLALYNLRDHLPN